jgi:hypothetical protein
MVGYMYSMRALYAEVKRVYDVYQYVCSAQGEYALDMHHTFSQHISNECNGTMAQVAAMRRKKGDFLT